MMGGMLPFIVASEATIVVAVPRRAAGVSPLRIRSLFGEIKHSRPIFLPSIFLPHGPDIPHANSLFKAVFFKVRKLGVRRLFCKCQRRFQPTIAQRLGGLTPNGTCLGSGTA
jgi:hypothetical protein